ncbi:hypothetical protein EVAR_68366_1 [Eumeta japonica]|uniref:Uncharacterized protein n=1 Tax=Eumeta variegata TaxID=151549 RepID=A0A4C1YYI7_EUMVA|nr:hypothetical protein EVAR_68366_1 [Eumeta japonica]
MILAPSETAARGECPGLPPSPPQIRGYLTADNLMDYPGALPTPPSVTRFTSTSFRSRDDSLKNIHRQRRPGQSESSAVALSAG